MRKQRLRFGLIALCMAPGGFAPAVRAQAAAVGIFENQSEVGATRLAGLAEFDPTVRRYTVAGGGDNMWATNDAFHYVWKKVSGDVTLAADIAFLGTGGNAHRKGCLIIRQSLEPDSPYADAAVHGDGLTSLQYREVRGERTYEIQSSVVGPKRVRIEKRGQYVSMSIATGGGELHPAGGAFRLALDGSFYVGLGVCAHDNTVIEKATFSAVELTTGAAPAAGRLHLFSTIETVPIASKDRRAVYSSTNLLGAPTWSRDGSNLFCTLRASPAGGRIIRVPATGGESVLLDTGSATNCAWGHGLSPDGKLLAVTDGSEVGISIIHLVPVAGGNPRPLTKTGHSSWSGWSPDGQTLLYDAMRDGQSDIYSIPLAGGAETALTTHQRRDGGAGLTQDGRWIYFHSARSGSAQIWRMRADGSQPEPVTNDEFNNRFPHPSPDGRWLVFISSERGPKGYLPYQDVTLRLIPLAGGKIEVLARLLGSEGTLFAPCWSPDSRKVAFASYQYVP